MSGHLRFSFVAFLLAGFLTSPASSNPFDALFGAAPAEATAPAPAEEQCLAQPGKSTEDGKHWIYRFDGHRKCWFLAAEGAAAVKNPVHHHHAAKQHVAAHEENEAAPRKRKAVVDARAELSHSAPAETPRAETAPAPELKVADAAPAIATAAAPLVPPAPLVANSMTDKSTTDQSTTDQLTPDHPAPRHVDVETLLAAAPTESDAVVASVPPAPPAAVRTTEIGNDGRGWTTTWLGLLLITLGLVSLLSSSRTLRGAMSVGRFLAPRTEPATVADEGFRRHL